jgi:CheY-like chemotaxis protein
VTHERSETESLGGSGIRVLVADDDAGVRSLLRTLLGTVEGVSSVLAVEDGAQAVQVARGVRIDVAVLDLNMPRLDGVEAARMLLALQPSMRIALHSSDPHDLHARAHGLKLPLRDKLDVDSLLEWVESQAVSGCDGRGRVSPLA